MDSGLGKMSMIWKMIKIIKKGKQSPCHIVRLNKYLLNEVRMNIPALLASSQCCYINPLLWQNILFTIR